MNDDEVLLTIAAVMIRQGAKRSGMDISQMTDIQQGWRTVKDLKGRAPIYYTELLDDAAAIMTELDKAKVINDSR